MTPIKHTVFGFALLIMGWVCFTQTAVHAKNSHTYFETLQESLITIQKFILKQKKPPGFYPIVNPC
ncbi:MAG: hypothetical protein JRE10_08950 [Deltaproteobacteria bacterium]|nr:hypothetical protein [Deltaproteobacteria bacterium]